MIDLSHRLINDMPVFPGKEQPSFSNIAFIETDGYREKHISADSHVGTHVDAPAHMLPLGKTLDQYPVSKFSGKAILINIPRNLKTIGRDFLIRFQREIEDSTYLLINTGWHQYFGTSDYTEGFPVIDVEAAGWLGNFSLKGIGVDTISVDPSTSETWPVHIRLFSNDLIIVENLRFPENISPKGEFFCFPLKIEGADGSPVRAVYKEL